MLYYINRRTLSLVLSHKEENSSDLFEVDENIIWAIGHLNMKGYKTLESCSGHLYKRDIIYVAFAKYYEFDSIPSGFKNSLNEAGNEGAICIEKRLTSIEGTPERFKEIADAITELNRWVSELPVIEGE